MDSGLYAACAGLMARSESLDTIASNLANASSNGFRGERNVFGTVLAQASHHGRMTALNQTTNSYGVLSGTAMDLTQGTLTHTGNTLDVALEGPGYFKVSTANGIAYTRDGSFQVNAAGQLTTAAGDLVLGEGGPLSVARGAVTISSDGTVSSGGAISGKLKIVDLPGSAHVANRGNSYYTADAGKEANAPTTTRVRQGSVESSNVSPVSGVVELIGAQRAAESMRHVLSLLDTEMDKTAAQDLPRVSAS